MTGVGLYLLRSSDGNTAPDRNETSSQDFTTTPMNNNRGNTDRDGQNGRQTTPTETVQPTETPVPERHGIEFDRIKNAVHDLGMDPSGEVPVNSAIERAGDGTLIQFPEGEYAFAQVENGAPIHEETRGFEGVGDDVRFVAPQGYNSFLLNGEGMDGVYFSDIDIDQSKPETCAGLRLIGDRGIIRNVEFVGRSDQFGHGITMLAIAARTPRSEYLVENVTKTRGHWAAYNDAGGQIGIFTGSRHQGILTVRNCDFREFPNNAMYTSQCAGDVRVYDSYFENNNVCAVRIGGDGSFVENSEIVVDPSSYTGPRGTPFQNQQFFMRGLFIEGHFRPETGVENQKPAGAAVRDTNIRIENNPTGAPAIDIRSQGRSLSVRDCTIVHNNDSSFVIFRDDDSYGNHPAGDPPRWLRMQDTEITGDGDVDDVIHLEDANKSILDSSTVSNSSPDTAGVRLVRSNSCLISDTVIDVDGEDVSTTESSVVRTTIGDGTDESGPS